MTLRSNIWLILAVLVAVGCTTETQTQRGTTATKKSTGADSQTVQTAGGNVLLTWSATDDNVTSYEVFFGRTQTTVSELAGTIQPVDPAAPGATLAMADLSLKSGDNACFYIVAVNATGRSPNSDVACAKVP